MVELNLTSSIMARTRDRLKSMRVYPGSHRGEQANRIGTLGEVLFESWLDANKIPFQRVESTKFDYLIQGRSVEVKTKQRSVDPEPHWTATLPAYNHEHQDAEWYAFLSITCTRDGNPRRAFLLGISSASAVSGSAVLRKAGEVDPSNGNKFWTDGWNIKHEDLGDPEDALLMWEELSW